MPPENNNIITGPPNGPVLFCTLTSVVVVCNAAGGPTGRQPNAWERGVGTMPAGGWPPGAWTVGAPVAERVGGRAADTARRASTVTSR